MWNWTRINHTLFALLHNLHCTKEAIMMIIGQRQEPWVRDTGRWENDEIPHGLHQQHQMIWGLTWQSTTHRTWGWRMLTAPNWAPSLFLFFLLFPFCFLFSSSLLIFFPFSLFIPILSLLLSFFHYFIIYHITPYHTIHTTTYNMHTLHLSHLRRPQQLGLDKTWTL